MNNKKEIEHVLKSFANLIKNNDQFLTVKTVYWNFTKYGIPLSERNFKISNLFDEWIEYFKDKSNINVFVKESWKYFCQFVNHEKDVDYQLSNPIKMYISSDSKHIKETAKILFDFLAENNIHHLSKIGSDIRIDDIVIRVYSKEDAMKISNFIQNNKYIKSGMQKISPFTFSKNGIGYGLDGNISYNETVCKYITDYINKCKLDNNLDSVSYNGFYNHILNIYNQVFVRKENLEGYYQNFCDNRKYPSEVMLNNYYEVTRLILENLNGNTYDKFISFVEFFNNKREVNKNIESFKVRKQYKITKEHIELFNEYIKTMYSKYGYDKAYMAIFEYVETGNIERVTRTNNLRDKFINYMSSDICKLIMGNLSFRDYYGKVIRLNQMDFYHEEIITQKDKDLLDEYIYVMNQKYGYEKAYSTILEYLNTGNVYKVTRTNNLRDRFQEQMNNRKVSMIVNNNLNGYMNFCIKNNLYLTKNYLDKAIIGTFKKYNDIVQVTTAINYALNGDYGYFTNQNFERDNLKKYVNPLTINIFFNSLLDKSIDNYVANCLNEYELDYQRGFSK